jgi:hypothetical protein
MPGTRRLTLRSLLRDCRGTTVALEALMAIPAFAGIIVLGHHLHERESTRSEMAREVRREAWGMALGSCQAAGSMAGLGASVKQAAQESFGVGLESAVGQAKLAPHIGQSDVQLKPRYAVTQRVSAMTRPLIMGGGSSQISSKIGVACNTVTRVRQFTRELHDVYKHFQFLFGA